jgi:hypothetical protein
MFEPHLETHHSHGGDDNGFGDGVSILDELDKLAPIKSFDAFPKVRLYPLVRFNSLLLLLLWLGLTCRSNPPTCQDPGGVEC